MPVTRRAHIHFVLLVVLIDGADAITRVALYGSSAVASSALQLVATAAGLALLVGGVPGRADVSGERGEVWRALAALTASYVALALVGWWWDQHAPGAIYPRVLYPRSPGLLSVVVQAVVGAVLRTALFVFAVLYPSARRRLAAEERRLARTRLEAERARHEIRAVPEELRAGLAAVADDLGRDPHRAREHLADLADQLDAFCARASSMAAAAAADPPRAARRRPSHAARALLAIACVAGPPLATPLLRYGAPAIAPQLLAGVQLVVEIGASFLLIAYADRREGAGWPLVALLATVMFVCGSGVLVVRWWTERRHPGLLFPAVMYTHPTPLARQLVAMVSTVVLKVAVLTLVYLHPRAIARAGERAERARELRREAVRERLWASLEPHFVRNALNTVAGLAVRSPGEARGLLRNLERLLVASRSDAEEHSLAEELAWLAEYAALLRARYPERLRFVWNHDPGLADVRLPRLSLQPLVENAVVHGALATPAGGFVRIATARTPRGFRCVVEDDGPGLAAGRGAGLGTRLVRERVEAASGSLRFEAVAAGRGTRAVVELPSPGAPT